MAAMPLRSEFLLMTAVYFNDAVVLVAWTFCYIPQRD